MLTKRIRFKGFNKKTKVNKIKNHLNELKKNFYNNLDPILISLSKKYKYSFNVKKN